MILHEMQNIPTEANGESRTPARLSGGQNFFVVVNNIIKSITLHMPELRHTSEKQKASITEPERGHRRKTLSGNKEFRDKYL
jgi:hypothetical protein